MQMNKPFCFSKNRNANSSIIWVAEICILIAAVYFISQNILTITVVNGNSMYPSLVNGNILLVNRLHKDYSRGDIILVRTDGADSDFFYIVKRVIAVGGEMLTIDYEKNEVYVDGEPLSEPYINREEVDPMQIAADVDTAEYVIPDGCFFVMGDNRNHSMDSRDEEIGFVSAEKVIGKVATPFEQKERRTQ